MYIDKKHLPSNMMIILIILYSIMPIVTRFVSSYLTTYFYLMVLLIMTLSITCVNGKISISRNMYILLPFLGWRFISLWIYNSDIILWLYQSLIELIPIILGVFIVEHRNKEKKAFTLIILIAFGVTCITTIRGLIIYPNASRWLATASSSQDAQLIAYDWLNIGGYSFVYSVVLLYPMLVLAFKKKRLGIVPTVTILVLIFVLIVTSGYTTALLLFGLTSVFFFMKRKLTGKDILIFSIALVFLIFFAWNFIVDGLTWVSGVIGNDDISYRLSLIAGGRNSLIGSEDNRIELYIKSLNTFLQHPFFGTFFSQMSSSGGHSFILDFLANYGLLGFGILVFMYRRIYFYFIRPYKNIDEFGYLLWGFVQTIIFSCINTGMWIYVLCLYMPCIAECVFDNDFESMETENENYIMDC